MHACGSRTQDRNCVRQVLLLYPFSGTHIITATAAAAAAAATATTTTTTTNPRHFLLNKLFFPLE